jgi:hypothetical protein
MEVFLTNNDSLPAHALNASIEAATRQSLWNLHQQNKIPEALPIAAKIAEYPVSKKENCLLPRFPGYSESYSGVL